MRRISSPGRRKVGFRQIAPRCARPQDPEDTIEDTPVVYAGDAAWFVREHRLDDAPFAVAQFIAHESRLHFGSLNHAWEGQINDRAGKSAVEGEQTCRRRGQNDAIDPFETFSRTLLDYQAASVIDARLGQRGGVPPISSTARPDPGTLRGKVQKCSAAPCDGLREHRHDHDGENVGGRRRSICQNCIARTRPSTQIGDRPAGCRLASEHIGERKCRAA